MKNNNTNNSINAIDSFTELLAELNHTFYSDGIYEDILGSSTEDIIKLQRYIAVGLHQLTKMNQEAAKLISKREKENETDNN